jgi:hypothetical protein
VNDLFATTLGVFNGPLIASIIIAASLGLILWSLFTAARRNRWGWFLFIFIPPGLGLILFWLVNPPAKGSGPRPA